MNRPGIVKICFVCLGNICRSPLAHGVFQDLITRESLDHAIETHSAGTGNWHVGDPPDQRMRITALRKGIRLKTRARQFQPRDFHRFDLVLAMDRSNQDALRRMCRNSDIEQKLRLFRSFDPQHNGDWDVPDPYYGGDDGFEHVFQIVHRTCPEVLKFLKSRFPLA